MKRRSLAFLFSVSLMVQNSFMTVNAVESSMPEEPIEEEENINTVEETENTSEEVQEESQIENVEIDIEDVSEQASVEEDIDSLQQYLDHELLGQQTAGKKRLMKASAGQKLSGYDLVAYTELKRQIEEVAAGTLSSTVFSVSMDAAGLTDQVWTAEDLGVDAIVVDGSVNDESVNKLRTILEIDHGKVVNALLADLPYDFYWFDKKQGWEYTGFSLGIKTVNNQYVLYVKGDSVFEMTVAQEFASGDYEVDSTVVSSLQASVENARGIVSQHASETDYEKICSYKDEILNDVSYNHEAADNGNTPYGNPWQVIWVFDNDPDTNVVCEGYAKAFKYLCDMSEFSSSNIECITVTGTMSGGTGAGAHMWNMITMDDGNQYMADLTNCDEGSIGYADQLFLKTYTSGNVNGGYVYTIHDENITYTYDEETRGLYSDDLLTIYTSDYNASSTVYGGECGANARWTLDDEGTLTVSGFGIMHDSFSLSDEDRLKVKKVIVEEGITRISFGAFYDCTNLETVLLSDGLKEIHSGAFWKCVSLKIISFPSSLEKINSLAFSESGLTDVEFNEGLIEIGENAFSKTQIQEVVLPAGLTVLGEQVFDYCDSLQSITIPGSVTTVPYRLCGECHNLSTVIMGEGTTSIDEGAFFGCSSLNSVTLPETLTYIGVNAFWECSSLESIDFPEQLETIDRMAFYCAGLTSLTLNEGLKKINEGAFTGIHVKSLTISTSAELGREVFNSGSLEEVTVTGNVKIIPENSFYSSRNLKKVTIEEGVEVI